MVAVKIVAVADIEVVAPAEGVGQTRVTVQLVLPGPRRKTLAKVGEKDNLFTC